MSDLAPAQQIRALCDRISDLVEVTESTTSIANYGGSEGSPGSRTVNYPMPDAIMDSREALKAILVSWARLIMEEARIEFDGRDEATSIAAWIYRQADWLAAHFAVDDFLTEVGEAVLDLAALVDRGVSTRKFCGWDNGHPVFTKGEDRLSGDGTVMTLRNGRAKLAVTVLDADLPAKDCAEALKLHGYHIGARKILKLHEVDERRRIAGKLGEYEGLSPVRVEMHGKRQQPIFRVSEVLSRIETSARHTRQRAS